MGFDVRASVEASSVQPWLAYGVSAEVPDAGSVAIGGPFSLLPQSVVSDGEMNLGSASVGLTVDTFLSVNDTFTGEVCAAGACTTWSETLDHIDDRGELFALTPNEMTFFDGFMPDLAGLTIPVGDVRAEMRLGVLPPNTQVSFSNGLPPIPPGSLGLSVDAAAAEVHIPQFQSAGTLGPDGVLRATGEDDYLDKIADIDLLFGFAGGLIVDVGPFEVTVDGHDIEAGSTYDHFQDVELASDVRVRFDFSRPVLVEGAGLLSEWEGLWDQMPDFAVTGPTLFTPTFLLDAEMSNRTGIQRGWFGRREILKGSIGFGPATAQFGPAEEDLWELEPDLLRDAQIDTGPFAFESFGEIRGDPFWIEPAASGPTPVPLPAAGWLLIAALGSSAAVLRRR